MAERIRVHVVAGVFNPLSVAIESSYVVNVAVPKRATDGPASKFSSLRPARPNADFGNMLRMSQWDEQFLFSLKENVSGPDTMLRLTVFLGGEQRETLVGTHGLRLQALRDAPSKSITNYWMALIHPSDDANVAGWLRADVYLDVGETLAEKAPYVPEPGSTKTVDLKNRLPFKSAGGTQPFPKTVYELKVDILEATDLPDTSIFFKPDCFVELQYFESPGEGGMNNGCRTRTVTGSLTPNWSETLTLLAELPSPASMFRFVIFREPLVSAPIQMAATPMMSLEALIQNPQMANRPIWMKLTGTDFTNAEEFAAIGFRPPEDEQTYLGALCLQFSISQSDTTEAVEGSLSKPTVATSPAIPRPAQKPFTLTAQVASLSGYTKSKMMLSYSVEICWGNFMVASEYGAPNEEFGDISFPGVLAPIVAQLPPYTSEMPDVYLRLYTSVRGNLKTLVATKCIPVGEIFGAQNQYKNFVWIPLSTALAPRTEHADLSALPPNDFPAYALYCKLALSAAGASVPATSETPTITAGTDFIRATIISGQGFKDQAYVSLRSNARGAKTSTQGNTRDSAPQWMETLVLKGINPSQPIELVAWVGEPGQQNQFKTPFVSLHDILAKSQIFLTCPGQDGVTVYLKIETGPMAQLGTKSTAQLLTTNVPVSIAVGKLTGCDATGTSLSVNIGSTVLTFAGENGQFFQVQDVQLPVRHLEGQTPILPSLTIHVIDAEKKVASSGTLAPRPLPVPKGSLSAGPHAKDTFEREIVSFLSAVSLVDSDHILDPRMEVLGGGILQVGYFNLGSNLAPKPEALFPTQELSLRLGVVRASGVYSRGVDATSQCYVVAKCAGFSVEFTQASTKGDGPEFGTEAMLPLRFPDASILELELWRQGTTDDDLIGTATANLLDRYLNPAWAMLKSKPLEWVKLSHPSSSQPQGTLEVLLDLSAGSPLTPSSSPLPRLPADVLALSA